jgi:voltage-gated potassium channel
MTATDRPTPMHRVVAKGVARALAAFVAVLAIYFLAPLDRLAEVSPYLSLPLALVGFTALIGVYVRSILRTDYPGVRALEALATCIPLFLVIFATTYYAAGLANPSWFSEPMSKIDSLYFTVTVFTTVGFGDIVATSPTMRGTVTLQMGADLIVIGAGLRIILGAVQEARQRQNRPAPGAD